MTCELKSRGTIQKQTKTIIFFGDLVAPHSPIICPFQSPEVCGELKHLWDDEAQAKLKQDRYPLNFDELTTIESHREHLETIDYLVRSRNRPSLFRLAECVMVDE